MKKQITRLLLATLNSRWLNATPCSYGFIGNVDAFSIEHLRSEESQRPGITVATIIREAAIFKTCPTRKNGVTVLEEGVEREANIWDLNDLWNLGHSPRASIAPSDDDLAQRPTSSQGDSNGQQADSNGQKEQAND